MFCNINAHSSRGEQKKMSPTHCRPSFVLNKRKERLVQLASVCESRETVTV